MTTFSRSVSVGADVTDEVADLVARSALGADRLAEMADVEVGTTPSEVVYEENKLSLHHYEPLVEGGPAHEVPILIVYALINRPYILDLQPNRSVVRRLLEGGHDVYLIDWGEPSRLDASLTLGDYVDRYLDNCVDVVRERAGVEEVNLLGYCMGGTMSTMYTALYPEKVNALALMAAGLCFDDTGGVLERWGEEAFYDPGRVANGDRLVPAEFFDLGFALMDPVDNTVTKYARLYDNLDDDAFVKNFARMERWLAEGIDMAGPTYRQFIKDVYQENKLARNEFELDGRPVDIGAIEVPLLQILATYDTLVPPTASRPFNDLVGTDDVTVLEHGTGHIGLSVSLSSHEALWPQVCDWFAELGGLEDLERIDGIGPAYAHRLWEAGIESVDDLAAADATSLAEATDVGESRAAAWIEAAAELA